ncbi:SDR family NAD(P)-dependent oxidoreductase [Spirosoma endbachense]|uniref:SDR family NAD(P)-dependent oxidoreductase n=1 Tax=Spirosoma endbachense TaxID=2666025 RepID=A0A6P1W8A0_9BACT|nr:SDR family NAD(P)-dependent oxidoreductase [Spirosoma endbachense]QHW00268.1 SDR family NAD(P)-dependent oxidoreductase [Spirosoma endbachense]
MVFTFENELVGKIALVTGGSKGAGKAIADRLLKAGATVIITARNKPEDETNGVHFMAADLSKPGRRAVLNNVRNKLVLRVFACVREDRNYDKKYTPALV